jgi:U3 small nucleolar RNA-associated protein 20
MPSTSSGRITKSRKGKNLTPHQKNHRWESFTTKISKLHSLDPLRRVRRHDLDAEDLETTTSYFRNGVNKWSELNLSADFISFKRSVLPITDSLAQILHFEDRIMELLVEHISKQDKESLEPLLDLLTAFAHDLGVRFEKHYATSLGLVKAIASKPQPVEVIEWTFAALAFLFKYLSKLLIPDLLPTYDVLSPLLGKARHTPHIVRFAAEAMSFLIKKAAAPSYRDSALDAIVEHIRDDLLSTKDSRQVELYMDGLMTMFVEAIKGPGDIIHSTGYATFTALLKAIPPEEYTLPLAMTWTQLCCGVLTSVIHHSTPTNMTGFIDAIYDHVGLSISNNLSTAPRWRHVPLLKVLTVLSGVRHGSRISNWGPLVQNLVAILDSITRSSSELPETQSKLGWSHVGMNITIIWHYAPIDALVPSLQELMKNFRREPLMRLFVPFCAYFSELNSERFRSLFQSHFQK